MIPFAIILIVAWCAFAIGFAWGGAWTTRRADQLEAELRDELIAVSRDHVKLQTDRVRLLAQCDAVDRALGATIAEMDWAVGKETRH